MKNTEVKDTRWIIGGIVSVIVLMISYILLWDNSFVTIHDYLDGGFPVPELIKNQNAVFNFSYDLGIMYGLKRGSIMMSYPWEIKPLIFFMIQGYAGYLVNYLLVHIMAFLGMWLLLHKYFVKNNVVAFLVSLCYSMIPFYVDYGISAAGIPLLMFALLNLKDRESIVLSYVIIVFYALYSSLVLSGVFACFFLTLWIIIRWFKNKKIDKHLFISLILIAVIYLSTNLGLILDFLGVGESFVSHRTEWPNTDSFWDLCVHAFNIVFLHNQYHAGSFYVLPILVVFFIVCFIYIKRDSSFVKYLMAFVVLAVFIFIGSLVQLIPITIFRSFQFDRFYFLYPALCFVLLGKSLDVLWCEKRKIFFAGALMISALGAIGMNQEYITNAARVFGYRKQAPSFSQFYDTRLFTQIAEDVNIPQDYSVKVVSLGMYPSIATYNGLWSLDGYSSSYPLDYKHRFRRVIEGELAKDESLRAYFDDWGSRCYVFSSELGRKFLYSKSDDKHVRELTINTDELKNMGCRYVFSAVTIDNYEDLNLNYINTYTNGDSYWKINVYELN